MPPFQRLSLLLGACMLVASLPAPAHEGATGIVKERMDGMETIANAMKEIHGRIVGNRDLAGIRPVAARIVALAQRMPQWFPPGSNMSPSEALPTIWQRWPEFQAGAARLEHEAGLLAAAASAGDPKGIAEQYRAVGEICNDCHRQFRAKR
jgi:cytochrome c556